MERSKEEEFVHLRSYVKDIQTKQQESELKNRERTLKLNEIQKHLEKIEQESHVLFKYEAELEATLLCEREKVNELSQLLKEMEMLNEEEKITMNIHSEIIQGSEQLIENCNAEKGNRSFVLENFRKKKFELESTNDKLNTDGILAEREKKRLIEENDILNTDLDAKRIIYNDLNNMDKCKCRQMAQVREEMKTIQNLFLENESSLKHAFEENGKAKTQYSNLKDILQDESRNMRLNNERSEIEPLSIQIEKLNGLDFNDDTHLELLESFSKDYLGVMKNFNFHDFKSEDFDPIQDIIDQINIKGPQRIRNRQDLEEMEAEIATVDNSVQNSLDIQKTVSTQNQKSKSVLASMCKKLEDSLAITQQISSSKEKIALDREKDDLLDRKQRLSEEEQLLVDLSAKRDETSESYDTSRMKLEQCEKNMHVVDKELLQIQRKISSLEDKNSTLTNRNTESKKKTKELQKKIVSIKDELHANTDLLKSSKQLTMDLKKQKGEKQVLIETSKVSSEKLFETQKTVLDERWDKIIDQFQEKKSRLLMENLKKEHKDKMKRMEKEYGDKITNLKNEIDSFP